MNKFINYTEFMHYLIDDREKAEKGGEIIQGILAAKSPRLTRIAEEMVGQSESNNKVIQRFIEEQVTSRNQEPPRCFAVLKELLGDCWIGSLAIGP
jgi:hypothetical protein